MALPVYSPSKGGKEESSGGKEMRVPRRGEVVGERITGESGEEKRQDKIERVEGSVPGMGRKKGTGRG